MKKFVLGGLSAAIMAFSGTTMAADFVAGKDYTVIANPGKVDVPGKIEVREFFGMVVRIVISLNRLCRLG